MDFPYIDEQTFENKDYLVDSLKKGEYEYCTFKSCNFSTINLSEFRFRETEFIECNFSNAQINNTSFQDVIFTSCKMLGLQFEWCNVLGFRSGLTIVNWIILLFIT